MVEKISPSYCRGLEGGCRCPEAHPVFPGVPGQTGNPETFPASGVRVKGRPEARRPCPECPSQSPRGQGTGVDPKPSGRGTLERHPPTPRGRTGRVATAPSRAHCQRSVKTLKRAGGEPAGIRLPHAVGSGNEPRRRTAQSPEQLPQLQRFV